MPNNIKVLREKKGLSQSELALAVGITRPYLSDIERDKSSPTVDIAARICRALDEPFERVFGEPCTVASGETEER